MYMYGRFRSATREANGSGPSEKQFFLAIYLIGGWRQPVLTDDGDGAGGSKQYLPQNRATAARISR
jgi:hypothetical protein